jgi:hypothetical protein
MFDTGRATLLAGGFVLALGTSLLQTAPAQAAVNCTAPGRPAGCVARPAPGGEAGAPGAGVRPGAGAGRAGAGAEPGVGAGAPGAGADPANRGGPVNRRGVR